MGHDGLQSPSSALAGRPSVSRRAVECCEVAESPEQVEDAEPEPVDDGPGPASDEEPETTVPARSERPLQRARKM